jgi:hypothetical protein
MMLLLDAVSGGFCMQCFLGFYLYISFSQIFVHIFLFCVLSLFHLLKRLLALRDLISCTRSGSQHGSERIQAKVR